MPRNVRNFWFDAQVDDRAAVVSAGPRARDGGMVIDLFQRNDGDVAPAFRITCMPYGNRLVTTIYEERDGDLHLLCEHETWR